MNVSPEVIAGLLVQLVLPLLVGLVTKSSTGAGVKNALLLGLTALNTGLLAVAGGETDYKAVGVTLLLNYATATAVHYKLYKPSGVTAVTQDLLVRDKPEAEYDPEFPADYEEVEAVDVGSEADEAAEEVDTSSESA